MPATYRRFHFEDYWLRLDGFHDTVTLAWNSIWDADPFMRIMLRLQNSASKLSRWSSRTTGNIRDKMAISRELISRFDKAQEDRILTPQEVQLRKQLKVTYLGLASLDRTIARQRARIAYLKDGDANTSFYHRQCTYRKQKNSIFSIATADRVVTEHSEMAETAFLHYDALLGTAVERDCTLDFSLLIDTQDLHDLNEPFSMDEIWNAVKRLPAHGTWPGRFHR
jgi:hypothetical protein